MSGKLKVLIVDDQQDLLELVGMELINYGYMVNTASSSEDACESLDLENFDVILSDIHMPGIDGLGLGRILKEAKTSCMSIAMSGHDIEAECREAGFSYFLSKPFSSQQLLVAINSTQKIH